MSLIGQQKNAMNKHSNNSEKQRNEWEVRAHRTR
jgi:hypothetical protein